MASWQALVRRAEARRREFERAEHQRLRELEKARKEEERLSELEAAALAVEEYEAQLAALLSLHKDCSSPVDWPLLACALPEHAPVQARPHKFIAELRKQVAELGIIASPGVSVVDGAQLLDAEEERESDKLFRSQRAEQDRLRELAHRVLRRDPAAYVDAVQEFADWDEIRGLQSPVRIEINSAELASCHFTVLGTQIVPEKVFSLTSSGRLSVKPVARSRFQEIYQDYVCGCLLRLGRELMGILPLDRVIITGSVLTSDDGAQSACPVLSVVLSRADLLLLNFAQLDPSLAITSLKHRGNVCASKRSGAFLEVIPFKVEEVAQPSERPTDLLTLLQKVRELRASLAEEVAQHARLRAKA